MWCRRFEPRRRRRRTAVTAASPATRGRLPPARRRRPVVCRLGSAGPSRPADVRARGVGGPGGPRSRHPVVSTRSGSGSDSPPARPRPPARRRPSRRSPPARARRHPPETARRPPLGAGERSRHRHGRGKPRPPPPCACAARPRSAAAPLRRAARAWSGHPDRVWRPCASTRRPRRGPGAVRGSESHAEPRGLTRLDGVQALDGAGGRLGVDARPSSSTEAAIAVLGGAQVGGRPSRRAAATAAGGRQRLKHGTGHVGIAGRRAGDAEAAVLRLRALEPGE